jgi:hypothetical protein
MAGVRGQGHVLGDAGACSQLRVNPSPRDLIRHQAESPLRPTVEELGKLEHDASVQLADERIQALVARREEAAVEHVSRRVRA